MTRQLREAQARLDGLRSAPLDPAVRPSDPELVRLRQELAVLRTRYTDQHPDVQAVLRRIAEREAIVVTAPPSAADRLSPMRRSAARSPRWSPCPPARPAWSRRWRVCARRPGACGQPRYDERRAALERERAQQQETYLALLRKQTEDQLAATRAREVPAELFRVVNPASPPERPFFPNPWLFASVGLLLGLTVGVGAALLAEASDRTVKDAEELRELLGLPLLVEIPFVPKRPSRR